jgi:transcriptional regulator with XRE-family HTH domain
MVQAKRELQSRARELRLAGKTYDEIVAELGVSKSSVSLWVRDLPEVPRRVPVREHVRRMAEARWAPYRERQARLRERTKAEAAADIGRMTDRELFLVGVGLYWAEGTKSKPYRVSESVIFTNSDPGVIRVYLAWLALVGVTDDRIRCRVAIHESADVAAAERYWAALVGVDVSALARTTLKKHNPKTVRKNVGEGYRGCLVVRVMDGADLYRRIEGWWYGIVVGAESAD